jgi:two-component system sensor histidine kinase HydH
VLSRIDMPKAVSQYLIGLSTDIPPACCVVDSESDRIYNLSVSKVEDCWSNSRDTVLMLDDVTEVKEAEADLLELEKLAERGTMVASIAHEIRNVLAILKGSLELSQLVLKRGDVGKSENYLSRAIDSANHLERFAVELMDNRKLKPELRLMQLNDVLANVVTFLKVQRRFKGITLVTDLDAGLPMLEMDNDQIAQLLLNFLNNSADAIREANRDEGQITLRTHHDKDGIVLSITDNGCGVPAEFRDKLFHLRFTTKKEGHGFGLVTCARVISNHKAQLRIDSEPGVYTTISVIFKSPAL